LIFVVVNVYSCSRCAFSTLRYDKLKEHLHKQHKVGSAPERRVRITDLVNFDLAKTIEGSVNQPEPVSQHQSLDASDTPVLVQPVFCITDWNISSGNARQEKQQTAVDSSAILVEPTDFLLGSVQPLHILPASSGSHTSLTPEDITMSSVLLGADFVKEN